MEPNTQHVKAMADTIAKTFIRELESDPQFSEHAKRDPEGTLKKVLKESGVTPTREEIPMLRKELNNNNQLKQLKSKTFGPGWIGAIIGGIFGALD
jgi:hypothetical protein